VSGKEGAERPVVDSLTGLAEGVEAEDDRAGWRCLRPAEPRMGDIRGTGDEAELVLVIPVGDVVEWVVVAVVVVVVVVVVWDWDRAI
jgi:hypothetical protein